MQLRNKCCIVSQLYKDAKRFLQDSNTLMHARICNENYCELKPLQIFSNVLLVFDQIHAESRKLVHEANFCQIRVRDMSLERICGSKTF